MALYRIKLDLIPAGAPANWRDCSYDLVVPLDRDGYLSIADWKERRAECVVRRLENGRPEHRGQLQCEAGGSWTIRYDTGRVFDVIRNPDALRFCEGERISIQERGGIFRQFRVAQIRPILNCVAFDHRRGAGHPLNYRR
ncbi:hypothetical protein [Inquilinus sp. OTU3971]|uniref:hypothetical protein n=1 Tax=Inquilinus sp. OTU3971 TaxID=3043855 RepID=UPI00313C86C1